MRNMAFLSNVRNQEMHLEKENTLPCTAYRKCCILFVYIFCVCYYLCIYVFEFMFVCWQSHCRDNCPVSRLTAPTTWAVGSATGPAGGLGCDICGRPGPLRRHASAAAGRGGRQQCHRPGADRSGQGPLPSPYVPQAPFSSCTTRACCLARSASTVAGTSFGRLLPSSSNPSLSCNAIV